MGKINRVGNSLPFPLALYYVRYIYQKEHGTPVEKLWQLKDASEIMVKFLSSIVAAVTLEKLLKKKTLSSKEHEFAQRILKPSGLSIGDWVWLLENFSEQVEFVQQFLNTKLEGVSKTAWQPTVISILKSIPQWRNKYIGHGVFRTKDFYNNLLIEKEPAIIAIYHQFGAHFTNMYLTDADGYKYTGLLDIQFDDPLMIELPADKFRKAIERAEEQGDEIRLNFHNISLYPFFVLYELDGKLYPSFYDKFQRKKARYLEILLGDHLLRRIEMLEDLKLKVKDSRATSTVGKIHTEAGIVGFLSQAIPVEHAEEILNRLRDTERDYQSIPEIEGRVWEFLKKNTKGVLFLIFDTKGGFLKKIF